jgi:ATP-dependent DNA ligase
MALPVRDLPVGNWLYEMKFDGYRALAFKEGSEKRSLANALLTFCFKISYFIAQNWLASRRRQRKA